MSKQQFDHAVDQILGVVSSENADDAEQDRMGRIVVAVISIIKKRRGIPDDAEVEVYGADLTALLHEFFSDITPRQRRLLKEMAEDLEQERLH